MPTRSDLRVLQLGFIAIGMLAAMSSLANGQKDLLQSEAQASVSAEQSSAAEAAMVPGAAEPPGQPKFEKSSSGLMVTPAAGPTIIAGMVLVSATDAPEKDPASYILSGSIDGLSFTEIARGEIPAFADRLTDQSFFFTNNASYSTYMLIFPTLLGPSGCCMQITEIHLLGTIAPVLLTAVRSVSGIVISWPVLNTGYVLESTDSLDAPDWTLIKSSGTNSITIEAPQVARFYRLRKE